MEWPLSIVQTSWDCLCGMRVYSVPVDINKWMPASKYWCVEHREVYCCPKCSLQAYTERLYK